MSIINVIFGFMGSLGLFLYGMSVLSYGIQKASGEKLRRSLELLTDNPLKGVLTGTFVTTIIQSSSATTVMVVTFVNAGLLTVIQAAGVIFGANIGTTITAWIVSIIGFKFKISSLALPLIGVGFCMMLFSKQKSKIYDYAEVLIGFGILFLGLDFLSHAIPKPDGSLLELVNKYSHLGFLTTLIAIVIGIVFTVLVHSSSATTAIVITMMLNNLIDFELAVGIILGSNIGTTIDAILASIGASVNAKRAALIHTFFNVFGTILVLIIYKPFVFLIHIVGKHLPIAQQAALFHTMFNVFTTIIVLPFTKQFCSLVSFVIKDEKKSNSDHFFHNELKYITLPFMNTPELNILRAKKEIKGMSLFVYEMFKSYKDFIQTKDNNIEVLKNVFEKKENYADEMREELTRFLFQCTQLELSSESNHNISIYLRVVVELEDITDECFRLVLLLDKAMKKNVTNDQKYFDDLLPYFNLADDFLKFVLENINKKLSDEQFSIASTCEDKIDEFKSKLKKDARKKIKSGTEVKYELLILDIIRHVERIGDHAFNISLSLRDLK